MGIGQYAVQSCIDQGIIVRSKPATLYPDAIEIAIVTTHPRIVAVVEPDIEVYNTEQIKCRDPPYPYGGARD